MIHGPKDRRRSGLPAKLVAAFSNGIASVNDLEIAPLHRLVAFASSVPARIDDTASVLDQLQGTDGALEFGDEAGNRLRPASPLRFPGLVEESVRLGHDG